MAIEIYIIHFLLGKTYTPIQILSYCNLNTNKLSHLIQKPCPTWDLIPKVSKYFQHETYLKIKCDFFP